MIKNDVSQHFYVLHHLEYTTHDFSSAPISPSWSEELQIEDKRQLKTRGQIIKKNKNMCEALYSTHERKKDMCQALQGTHKRSGQPKSCAEHYNTQEEQHAKLKKTMKKHSS